jgi:hypothetical protein
MRLTDEEEEAYRWMVEFAAESAATTIDGGGPLVAELVDFLVGDRDGVPRDPRFLFQLYVRWEN